VTDHPSTDPSTDASPTPTEDTDPEAAAGEVEQEFTNRAARRAKGKGKETGRTQPHDSGPNFHGRGSVQGPRQWGNRRSG